jgi:hypothetical protein
LGKTGKAVVHLVFDQNYQVVGVATGTQVKFDKFSDGPVKVVGPVVIGEPINWDQVEEELYGPWDPREQMHEYVYMNDGVPPVPLTTYEEFGIRS